MAQLMTAFVGPAILRITTQVNMGSRLSFVFLMLVISFIVANARNLDVLSEFDVQLDNKVRGETSVGTNEKVCTLCEEYASQAIKYLAENETQSYIVSALHDACSQLHALEKQACSSSDICISLVDYYLPIFFLEVSELSSEELCERVNLCGESVLLKLPKNDGACTICHDVVVEILTKLKDPDAQLEVMEMLLKGCNQMGNYAEQCKNLVLHYGQLILINAQTFLETTDVCLAIHACNYSQDLTGSVLADA
ncbi:proactivator polypeptide-like 1 [Canna indica]|uniref:Proactivator polypeptide-like 1 n=1 Tax=Canna indica TaxID=4628 RepID=A0AAQ3QDF4_9LILI|nr:proactivator polypeptide-like 1 [Canna indica]